MILKNDTIYAVYIYCMCVFIYFLKFQKIFSECKIGHVQNRISEILLNIFKKTIFVCIY